MTEMRQYAPYPDELDEMVKQLAVYPGWSFVLGDIVRDHKHSEDGWETEPLAGGLTLDIVVAVPNAYDFTQPRRVHHYFPVPAATYDRRSWRAWLRSCCEKVNTHELNEHFRIGDERPYAPSHGPGSDPYLTRELGTEEDVNTSFQGVLKT